MNHRTLTLVFVTVLLCAVGVQPRNLVTLESGDLPYAASSNDSIQIDGDHITASGTAITASSVNNVYFDFGTDTLEFGSGGGNSAYGIDFQNAHDCIVSGGTIMRAVGYSADDGTSNHAIYMHGTCYNMTFNDADLITDGHDGHCVLGYGPHYMVHFNGGTWRSDSRSFSDRHTYTGAVAWLGTPGSSGDYDYWVEHVTVENGPCQGIISISALIIIDSCTITVDHTNIGPSGSNANQYAILLTGAHPGTQIINNHIISGSNRGGSRGILIENSNGSSDSHILVRNNTLDAHNGPDAESSGGSLRSIRLRSIDGGTVSYVDIFSNLIYTTADTNDATTHIGQEALGLDIKMYSSTGSAAHHIRVDSNTVYSRSLSQGTWSKAAAVYAYGSVDTSGCSFSHNELYFCDHGLHLADEGNGIASRDFLYDSNTVTIMDTTVATGNDSLVLDSDLETWHIGVYSGDQIPTATGNVALDNEYFNGALPTDINFNPGAPGAGDLTLKRTLNLYVKDTSSLPIEGASVWAINNYGDTVLSGTSSAAGLVSGAVTWYYDHSTGTDSTAFNDFTLKALKGSDSTTTGQTVDNTVDDIVLTLGATQGEEPQLPTGIYGKGRGEGNMRIEQ